MTETKAIIAIVVGFAAIYFGFTIKQFYAAKALYGAVGGHEVARWKGRLLFLIVGALSLVAGFAYFYYNAFHSV
jgi:hypothetical protein